MTSSFKIGRVAGIEIGVHWSWVLIVALIVWSLSDAVFPETNPGLSDETYLVMGIVAVLLFFTTLLAHELGHAVQAVREGMEMDGITLWVFGGVARFRSMFPSAGAEFRVAIAGPIISLVIGASALAAALLIPFGNAVDGVVFWVGYVNLVILAFNMVPALPLDGGRVLRSALWQRKGDLMAATRTAAGIGQGFGQVLIALGVAVALFGGAIGGLWFVFIGWFILAAAAAERDQAETRHALRGVTVRDIMASDPVTVAEDTSLRTFMDDVFGVHHHVAYPVLGDGGAPVGLVSFRQALTEPRDSWDQRRVRDVMIPLSDAPSVGPDASLDSALETLREPSIGRALVLGDDNELTGLLSRTDALREMEARRGVPEV